ncbi:hypothetical protein PM082_006219 [Marasmius tenuissimus]|nr:hypothetical protein PM082_006219 [Marasmius tenuissimus]
MSALLNRVDRVYGCCPIECKILRVHRIYRLSNFNNGSDPLDCKSKHAEGRSNTDCRRYCIKNSSQPGVMMNDSSIPVLLDNEWRVMIWQIGVKSWNRQMGSD